MAGGVQLHEMGRDDALSLLGSVSLGRVVFTVRALPAIRPVNHIVESGHIVIRTHPGAAIATAARDGVVVAYEADEIDPVDHTGWSVVITGVARLVDTPDALIRYGARLHPWASSPVKNQIIRIRADLVTGFRLTVSHEELDAQPVRQGGR